MFLWLIFEIYNWNIKSPKLSLKPNPKLKYWKNKLYYILSMVQDNLKAQKLKMCHEQAKISIFFWQDLDGFRLQHIVLR